ncbi:MAG: thioredoxin family protein [Chromatiales bacterium]|nr:thioredoxin family protein [Chromatiales bacterium]
MRAVMLLLMLCLPAWVSAGIAWQSDYEGAKRQAAEDGLPLLVYFDARWCSWCHRYLEETLSEPRVVARLQRRYLAVKVDWDARPDLVRAYGANGLPYTVLLGPDGQPWNRFVGLLSADDLLARLRQGGVGLDDVALRQVSPLLRPSRLDAAGWRQFEREWLAYLERLWTPESGGLHGQFDSGLSAKWPQPLSWLWLEENGHWAARQAAGRHSELRLWDELGGGFFNYAEPRAEHLETSKLLDQNAWLAAWLSGAPEARPRQAARSALAWLGSLQSEGGAFYLARQADAGYYALDARGRAQAGLPALDPIIRADSNGWAVWGLACAVQRGAAPQSTLAMAEAAMADVLAKLQREGRLVHHYRDGVLGQQVWPEDWLALLAAGAALQRLQPEAGWPERLADILQAASDWAVSQQGKALDSDRAALLAWVVGQPDYRAAFAEGSLAWALGNLALGAETLPDSLVPGLAAWQRELGREPGPRECF